MAKLGKWSSATKCSFCGKAQDRVAKLVAGPGVSICNECVGLCNDIMDSAVGRPLAGTGASGSPAGTRPRDDSPVRNPERGRPARAALGARLWLRLTASGLA